LNQNIANWFPPFSNLGIHHGNSTRLRNALGADGGNGIPWAVAARVRA